MERQKRNDVSSVNKLSLSNIEWKFIVFFFRTKGAVVVDIRQIYRDCNTASHYLEDSLTTTKVKGPLRGKNLVIFRVLMIPQHQERIERCVGALLVALQCDHLKCAILLQCKPYGVSKPSKLLQ